MTSTVRIEANRANARKSTGPRTEAGKARSRMNALDHGLRAEQVVLPNEDASAFEAERTAFFDEWSPPTATRAVLVERLVADAWRLRRCVRVEGARLGRIAEEAGREFDEAAGAEIDEAARRLADLPGWAVQRLEGSRTGAGMFRASWEGMAEVLAIEGEWKDVDRHHGAFCRLLGLDPRVSPAELGDAAMASWTLLITNAPATAGRLPWDDPDGELSRPYPEARAEKVRGLLRELAAREVVRLERLHDRLPDPGPERDRFVDGRCVDSSKEAAALQRYEAMHDRSFRSNLKLLIELTRTGADLVEPSAPNGPNDPGDVVGIGGEPRHEHSDAQDSRANQPRDVGAPTEPNDATAEEVEMAPAPNEPKPPRPKRASRRDRRGRSWPSGGSEGADGGPSNP